MVNFNPEQQHVIQLRSGFHSCLAPAGSGKTEILTERIVQALSNHTPPEQMLCLTFTNRAGINMREKVSKALHHEVNGLFIGNIHAFCTKFIQINRVYPQQYLLMDENLSDRLMDKALEKTFELLEFAPDYIIANLSDVLAHYQIPSQNIQTLDSDTLNILRYRIQVKNTDNQYDIWHLKNLRLLVLPLVSKFKENLGTELTNFIRHKLRTFDEKIHPKLLKYAFAFTVYLHHCYEQLKERYRLYDYDDLILTTIHYLQQHPHCKMRNYSWIQIDEVQDLSPLHWLLLQLIQTPDAHILILGDTYQSIYRFLGASIELTQSKLGLHVYKLKQNYRSPANLVSMFNDYSAFHFNQAEHQAFTHNPSEQKALLHLHRRYDSEQLHDLADYVHKHINHQESTAVLFSRNQDVQTFSTILKNKQLKHFVISQFDILQTEPALDFLAFISVLQNSNNRLAWARLLWRFGDLNTHRPQHLLEHEPQFAAIRYLADLEQQGALLEDFIGQPNCYQHALKGLLEAHEQHQTAFFDTETTGLNPYQDDIIQIAAITDQHSIDLYCHTDRDLTASQNIHHISQDILRCKGKNLAEQLQHFLDFSQNKILIAHNLKFDDAMLYHAIAQHLPEHLDRYSDLPKLCSLQLVRRFYPNLDSYKLADLLTMFQLKGINSHNALDDVYAGQQLLEFILEKIEINIPELNSLIDFGEATLNEFIAKFSPLYQLAQRQLHQPKLKLDDLFYLFFDYLQQHQFGFITTDYHYKMAELQEKMLNHAAVHFHTENQHSVQLEKAIEFYQTAKESDLITQKDAFIVSTIHRSKGLEFDNVVLPSVTDDVFPSYPIKAKQKSPDPQHQAEASQMFQEQKRLLYVALTRSKKKLIIGSYSLRASQIDWGKPPHYKLSSFMNCVLQHFEKI